MRFAFEHLKLVVEPGGAVGLAAVLSGEAAEMGQTIGVVVSGGNVSEETFETALCQDRRFEAGPIAPEVASTRY